MKELETNHKSNKLPEEEIVEVKFKGERKDFFLNPKKLLLKKGQFVMVQAKFGYDIGIVSLTHESALLQIAKKTIKIEKITKIIYAQTSSEAYEKIQIFKKKETDVMRKARVIATTLQLDMKICDVDYQGDLRTATFYYTANERVDFRELIQKLVAAFNVNVIMKHISPIEEMRRLGGIGICGRANCYSTWLTFKPQKNNKSEFNCCLT
jgi:cell fate regulator YaaT (PSP1 superfamily)